jgi:hypothetical protein
MSPASLQTFTDRQGQGDTRLTLPPPVIPNSNYVIMVSDWNILKYFCVFFAADQKYLEVLKRGAGENHLERSCDK